MANFDDLKPMQKMITRLLLNTLTGEKPLYFKNSSNATSSFIIVEQPKPPRPGERMPHVENDNQLVTLLIGGIIAVWLENKNKPIADYTGPINDLAAINHCNGDNGGTLKILREILQHYNREYLVFPLKFVLSLASYNVLGAMLAANSSMISSDELKEAGNFPGDQVFIVWRQTSDKHLIVTPVNRELLENVLVFHANVTAKLSERLLGSNESPQLRAISYARGVIQEESWPTDGSYSSSEKLILGSGLPVPRIRLTPSELGVQYFVGMELLATPDKIYMRPIGGKLGNHVPKTDYEDIVKFIKYVATNHATLIGNDREFMLSLKTLVESGLNKEDPELTREYMYNFVLPMFMDGLRNSQVSIAARNLLKPKAASVTESALVDATEEEKTLFDNDKYSSGSLFSLEEDLDLLHEKLERDDLLFMIDRATYLSKSSEVSLANLTHRQGMFSSDSQTTHGPRLMQFRGSNAVNSNKDTHTPTVDGKNNSRESTYSKGFRNGS